MIHSSPCWDDIAKFFTDFITKCFKPPFDEYKQAKLNSPKKTDDPDTFHFDRVLITILQDISSTLDPEFTIPKFSILSLISFLSPEIMLDASSAQQISANTSHQLALLCWESENYSYLCFYIWEFALGLDSKNEAMLVEAIRHALIAEEYSKTLDCLKKSETSYKKILSQLIHYCQRGESDLIEDILLTHPFPTVFAPLISQLKQTYFVF
jgi:hypothetical protein